MKQIEHQDIKLIIDRLELIEFSDSPSKTAKLAISMLEDLGNAYHALQLENAKLKEDILRIESYTGDE